MCVCRVGVDRVSGLGSMLYGTTLRGHVPSDLAFRSHLGSNLELSCLPELGAVLFAMSGDQQRGDHCCWICGDADHLSYQCPDNCCWICGDRDHWSDHCPDNCCWICGDRDHWSYRCPRNMKPYDSLVEAMIDLRFKDLHGEDLMSAYLIDIAASEQRVDNVNELGRSILQERLGLLRRKAEELAMVIG